MPQIDALDAGSLRRCIAVSRQSEEASLFALVGIIALVCNFTGILLLVRQGVPHRLLADSLALAREPEQGALSGSDRRRMLSFAGLVLLTLGTAMQMAAIVLRSN